MVPHVVVPPTNLFSFIFLFLIYFAWKIYGKPCGTSDKQNESDLPSTYIYISRPERVRKPVCQYSHIFSKRNISENKSSPLIRIGLLTDVRTHNIHCTFTQVPVDRTPIWYPMSVHNYILILDKAFNIDHFVCLISYTFHCLLFLSPFIELGRCAC
jgi:hypothetical protein